MKNRMKTLGGTNRRNRNRDAFGKSFTDITDLAADFLHLVPGNLKLLSGNRAKLLILVLESFQRLLGRLDLPGQCFLLFLCLLSLRTSL